MMYSRGRRKQRSFQGIQMYPRKSILLALFAIVCSCTFTYVTLYEARSHAAAGTYFSLPVLKWFKDSSIDSQSEEKNVVNKEFSFVIKVLAYNRYDSLRRCLKSLTVADYGGDSVSLSIFVDHFKGEPQEHVNKTDAASDGLTSRGAKRRLLSETSNSEESNLRSETGNLKASENVNGSEEGVIKTLDEVDTDAEELVSDNDPVEQNLQQAHQLLHFLDNLNWPHGTKEVHYRSHNLGLQGQWLEAWWPSSDHQFAFIVEDDMQLSPLYYRYVRSIIANYYYNPANFDPSIFGISLQRPRFVAGKGGNSIQVENSTRLFLYQMVGSWGQILFPKPWKEFRLWFDAHKARGIKPILGGMVTSGWYRKLGDKIWTPWFVKFAHSRGYFNMYTNFLKERALSVSHRDEGVNYRKDTGPDSKLIRRRGVTDINLWEMPPLKALKWYDFCFQQVFPGRFVNGSDGLEKLLSDLHSQHTVLLVGIIDVAEAVVKNWLCQLASFGLNNYLLIGNDYDLLKDLARRGHAVMLVSPAEGESDDSATQLSLRAMQQVLTLGYNIWFARADSLWMNYSLAGITTDSSADMLAAAVGKAYHTGFFFIRSTYKAQQLLKNLVKSTETPDNVLGRSLWSAASMSDVVVETLEPVIVVDGTKNWTTPEATILLFEGIENSDALVARLKAAGLWMIDDELACNRVHCQHKGNLL